MPAKKKTPEKRRTYVNTTCEAFIKRLSGGGMLSDKEVALFATLLQTVDNQTLEATIAERLESWEMRLRDMERFLESRQALRQATQPNRRATHPGPPNLSPFDGAGG